MSMSVIEINTFQDLRDLCKRVTATARETEKPSVATKAPTSDLAKTLQSIWDKSDFDRYAPAVGEVMSAVLKAVTKEEVTFSKASPSSFTKPIKKFQVCFLTGSSNKGELYIVRRERSCLSGSVSGRDLNHDLWRYATDGEIDELFASSSFTGSEAAIMKYLLD